MPVIPTVPPSLAHRVLAAVAPHRRDEQLLWAGGLLLLASAVLHTAVWLVSGEPWTGAVSWRKPIVFAASFGSTLVTLGWVLGQLPGRRRLGMALAAGLVVSGIAEVGLITMQRWRGVPSHFNVATPFDEAVFSAMGVAIAVFAGLTVVLLGWVAVRAPRTGPAGIAALAGLAFLLVAQGLGGPLIAEGAAATAATGAVPSQVTIGAAGVGKLPHGLGVHGLQVLALLAVLTAAGSLDARRQRRAVWDGSAGYALVLAWAVAQTYRGRAPLDLDLASGALLVAGAVLLIVAAGRVVAGLRPSGVRVAHGSADGEPATRVAL